MSIGNGGGFGGSDFIGAVLRTQVTYLITV
jgi:hypothetical protein